MNFSLKDRVMIVTGCLAWIFILALLCVVAKLVFTLMTFKIIFYICIPIFIALLMTGYYYARQIYHAGRLLISQAERKKRNAERANK